ncbi:hypothetical protein [Pseudofrankia sp. DC12]|uniref:hypothetical protein n=1 Tax=Pseudofrankia sp. DC12 TaxID=683315 RepID=UPI0005F7E4E8|nr:hypothetical protein [Pseudofrankia sp. DC12]
MPADIILDDSDDGLVTIQGEILKSETTDFKLDSPERRSVDGGERRALVHNVNDGLTVNFEGDYPGGVSIDGDVLRAHSYELHLDSASRRHSPRGKRRALTHDTNDGLTLNIDGDYPGGVTIRGAHLNLKVSVVEGVDIKLPRTAGIGDLLLVQNVDADPLFANPHTLWLCVGPDAVTGSTDAVWVQVPLGDFVLGTE